MRIILSWLDQLRRTTVQGLPSFCAALVSQLEEIAAAANTWAAVDHNSAGTHGVVKFSQQASAPDALTSHLEVYWDGTNLKYVKPDGSTGNIV